MRKLTTFVLGSLMLASCGNTTTQVPTTSSLDSVVIPQSPIKDQGSVGFCWAYALSAFIESETLRRTGRTINVSEEHIALYRMAAEIAQDLRAGESRYKIEQKIFNSDYEGWFVRLPDRYDNEATDAMELVDKFGILEEHEWGVKFPNVMFPFTPTRLANGGYKADLVRLVGLLDKTASDDEVVRAVAESFGKGRPPEGHNISIKSKDYVSLWAESAADTESIMRRAKKELAEGRAVPMSYGVTFAKLNQDRWMWMGGRGKTASSYEFMDPRTAASQYAADGAHAVLMTDFVNVGGMEGRISDSALRDAVAAPLTSLDYVVFKNSWGTEVGMPPGYYRLDTSYILGTSQAGIFDVVVRR